MKKISLILFVLVFVVTLTLNISRKNKEYTTTLLIIDNIEALASESDSKIVYCCSPYTSICVAGVTVPDVMGKRQETECGN